MVFYLILLCVVVYFVLKQNSKQKKTDDNDIKKVENDHSQVVPVVSYGNKYEDTIERTETEWREYFREIIKKNFSMYTVREDVPVTDVTGDIYDKFQLYKTRPNQMYKAEWGRPYDFVLYQNDKVKAVVVIGNSKSGINVKYLISKVFAEKCDIPFIGFYVKFPNKEDYVVQRIKEFIGESDDSADDTTIERTMKEWKDYFREIIQNNFTDYTIREDVPVTQLTGDVSDIFRLYKTRPNQAYKAEWGRPYDFVFYKDNVVKAVVVIGDDKSYKNVKCLISKMFAKKLQTPYIGFYIKFPNKENYVVERIREILNN